MEILWSGVHSLVAGDRKLLSRTSLWMFPIYGCAFMLQPVFWLIAPMPLVVRGLVYMTLIFAFEFVSGWVLRDILKACPWDYSHSRFGVYGLIRIDYAPGWFAAGLVFEGIFAALGQLGL